MGAKIDSLQKTIDEAESTRKAQAEALRAFVDEENKGKQSLESQLGKLNGLYQPETYTYFRVKSSIVSRNSQLESEVEGLKKKLLTEQNERQEIEASLRKTIEEYHNTIHLTSVVL